MIKSMTGYGEAIGTLEGKNILIQIKSVNNRFLDISVKLPRLLMFAENEIKASVQSRTSRGKSMFF